MSILKLQPGTIRHGKKIIRHRFSTGNIDYYEVECLQCGNKSLIRMDGMRKTRMHCPECRKKFYRGERW